MLNHFIIFHIYFLILTHLVQSNQIFIDRIIIHTLYEMSTIKQRYPVKELLALFVISVSIKVLLIPAYFSTDFDVHQNWLRITKTQPLKNWYYDTESKWTFDYPPLFAYFEWFLAQISIFVNENIAANINQLEVTIYYQRVTVILSEIPFLLVLYQIIKSINFKFIIAYFSLPFILLDNIHFQYNIIMQALFLLSIYFIQQKEFLKGAFTYSCLLNFKHIYLYSSIAFLAYILKHYVWKAQSHRGKIVNLAKVGAATIIPFIVSFLPFLLVGGVDQITQILSRLFPFQRGLIHEFWAPNFWALYHFADKLMNIICAKFLLSSSVTFREVSSDLHQLKILPQVTPLCTTIIILLLTVPIIIKLINHNVKFHKLVFICGSLFFMFGFHVHEKAITPYVSLLLVFLTNKEEKEGSYYISSAVFVNIINLLPLLIDSNEKLLRICLPFLWIAIWEHKYQLGSYLDSIIFATGITINMYHELVHPFIRSDRLEFLPLMLNSVFAATFNLCWLIVIYYGQIKSNQEIADQRSAYAEVSTVQE